MKHDSDRQDFSWDYVNIDNLCRKNRIASDKG